MNSSNSSVVSDTATDCTYTNSVLAKLRRLKIQEGLLIQSVKKSISSYEVAGNDFIKSCLEYKSYVTNLKNTFIDIKNLFEDVKSATKLYDEIKYVELNTVKNDVLNLEEKIKSCKSLLFREYTNMKKSEQQITNELTIESSQIKKMKPVTKFPIKNYADIVPSPVKIIISSPFKSSEVQEFHDFLSKSNKCGGWNEYNHNIFVKLWQKYFDCDEADITPESADSFETNNIFISEVLHKVAGVKRNDIISHIRWYSKYLYLKQRKKQALDEWKSKNRAIKMPHQGSIQSKRDLVTKKNEHGMTSGNKSSGKLTRTGERIKIDGLMDDINIDQRNTPSEYVYQSIDVNEYLKDVKPQNRSMEHVVRDQINDKVNPTFNFAKPTQQWENRCNRTEERRQESHLDAIKKL